MMFFTIAGNMWLFAGIHIRDSVIFFLIVLLSHFWIAYLSELKHSKAIVAVAATVLAMPILEALRKEFFYVPLFVGFAGLACLNFARGRGDQRFIMLLSLGAGIIFAAIGIFAFGDEIRTLFLAGQQGYGDAATAEARSGSLGAALIVDQPTLIRIALGVPYLLYFPIPFWVGFSGESAYALFKSINAFTFYLISAFVFSGAFMILSDRRLRSPGFMFALIVPFALASVIALTSLESRHLGAFMSLFFLVGLMPDLRDQTDERAFRFSLMLTSLSMVLLHAAWFAVRYV